MTSDERAFLNAICEYPDDDTARLVYADWLADNGDPDRGEFIRADIEFARTPPTTEEDERRRKVLLERRAELLKKHKAAWLAPFMPFAKDESFARGFVQSLDIPASIFLQHAGKWFSLTPLTRVRFTNCSVWDQGMLRWVSDALFASPLLSRLSAVTIETQGVTATNLEPLAAHSDLSRWRELNLSGNELRSDGASLLAGMPQLRNLKSLDLRGNGITDLGARALIRSAHLGGLEELQISRNPIRGRSWQMLEDRFGDALRA